jgi:hypothetical protein
MTETNRKFATTIEFIEGDPPATDAAPSSAEVTRQLLEKSDARVDRLSARIDELEAQLAEATNAREIAECAAYKYSTKVAEVEAREAKMRAILGGATSNQLISDLKVLLVDVAQIFDGWHADGTPWSEWDESVRRRVTDLLESIDKPNGADAPKVCDTP